MGVDAAQSARSIATGEIRKVFLTVLSTKQSLRWEFPKDIKKRYEAAMSKKKKVQGMTGKIDVSHGGEQQVPHNAHQSPQHLDEIALKPNPLTQIEYLKLLTEFEKSEAKPAWKKRIQ